MIFSPISAIPLFLVMLLLIEAGRRLHARTGVQPSSAIEGAVFALFGLLLAFTFSGAMSRYDAHRQLIVQETNDIGTAYLRLDLLPTASQPSLRQIFRDYAVVRAHRFDELPDNPQSIEASAQTDRLLNQIWSQSVTAAALPTASPDASKLLLPALNDMIDITSTRRNAFNMHPPDVVFLLLFTLGCGCALLAGFSMAGARRNWLYMLAFSAIVSITIYATLDVEYPRRGLIRLTTQEQAFTDLRNSMK
jgi:hypothetical protein